MDGLRAASCVLANSYYSREAILRTTGRSAAVCYLGVDAEAFRPDGDAAREHSVLSVGNLTPAKRHELVIDAVATIATDRRPRVDVVGYRANGASPYAATLAGRAERQAVRLCLHADVSDDALRSHYARAGVVAVAPYLEPFGLVTLEAQACAAPVVGVPEGGVRETVVDGETGLLAPPEPAAFGATLDRVLMDSTLAARLGAGGREAALRCWTWERSVDTLEPLLTDAAASRAR